MTTREAPPMMQCGHAANSHRPDGSPACVICIRTGEPGDPAVMVAVTPDLTGRKARCSYFSTCKSETISSTKLAFFEHRPAKPHDNYYCGCMGWE